MRASNVPHGSAWRRPQVRGLQVAVSIAAGACLLIEALVAKDVIDVELDFFSQFAPMWISSPTW